MNRVFRSLGFALLLLAVFAAPALPQVLPTGNPRELDERALQRRLEVRRDALRGTTELLDRWTEAWNGDDARRIARFYTVDAVLLPAQGDAQLRGQDQIERSLQGTLDAAGEIQVTLTDFDGTGSFAYALGKFSYVGHGDDDNGSARTLEGSVLLVLRREGGDWRIRSQFFDSRG